ncbi:MAG: hypothetical protein HY551_06665 [Elusimicrobia bacterium]|nr:hypothetical protein [Elusimicrobiota bacterium]
MRPERLLVVLCWGVAAAIFLLPISNPDLFWHLSAAQRILDLGALPRHDWLSHTRLGAPWVDFEWGSQLLFWAAHRCGGAWGLWALKGVLVALIAAGVHATLKLYRLPAPIRAAGLSLWAAAMLARSDLRPDLFSVLGFTFLFVALEARRLSRESRLLICLHPAASAIIFGLWANLHAGFAYGLLLLAAYAAGESAQFLWTPRDVNAGRSARPRRLWSSCFGAIAGTFMVPFGLDGYRVLWTHWRDMEMLRAYISEWGPIRWDNPWHWPTWTLLAAGGLAASSRIFRFRTVAPAPLAVFIITAYAALEHARLGSFFAACGAPLAAHWGWEAVSSRERRAGRRVAAVCAVIVLTSALYAVGWGMRFGLFRKSVDFRFVPVRAARFLYEQKRLLGGRALYHRWGWGGYLGWALYPPYRVFEDGRYIFHDLLGESAAATSTPQAWREFLDRYGIELAVMENIPKRLPTTRLYPDGSTKTFLRPYYAVYMPKEQWALVYWDDQALVFLKRPASMKASLWMLKHEYRYARPFDEEALADAVRRREIPKGVLEEELERHAREQRALLHETARRF